MSQHQTKTTAVVSELLAWFPGAARDLPWRRTSDPYAIWVSEVMLQQTQVKTVLGYWQRWMEALPTLEDLARAPASRLHKLWEGLGYYSRVRNMQKTAKLILRDHAGSFPREHAQLLALPGIGRYTAGAICSIAFNQPTPILDGNVIRVLARLFAVPGNPRDQQTNGKLWALAEKLVQTGAATTRPDFAAEPRCSHLNQALMELGALICTPRRPDCVACPVRRLCRARRKGRVADFPELPPRPKQTARRYLAFAIARGGRYLVRQRPDGVVNAHLWEFPTLEIPVATADLGKLAARTLGESARELQHLCTVSHSITRYLIRMDVFHARIQPGRLPPQFANGRWQTIAHLRRLPFPSAHQRIVARLANQARAAGTELSVFT